MRNFAYWMKGLLGAAIGGAANSITVMVIDPMSYNFTDGIGKLGAVAGVSAIISAALYLKEAPVWSDK